MKKLLFIFSLILVLFTVSIKINAATTITSGKADKSEEVTLDIKLTDTKTVKSGAISFEYDKNEFTIVSGEWKVSNALLTNFDLSTELGAFAYMNATSVTGTIFIIKFKVSSTTAYGKYAVVANLQFEDASGNKTTESVTGYITVGCSHSYTVKNQSDEYLASKATCTSAAKYYYLCSKCNEKGTTTYTVGNSLGHTGGTASCTKKAVCTRCNQQYGSLLEHSYGEWEVIEEATEEKEGTKQKTCSSCNNKITEKIPTLGHTHKYENSTLIEATCETKGLNKHTCSCGDNYDEIINEKNHNYSDFTILVEPTEQSVGYKQKVCSECDDIVLEEIEKLTHTHEFNDKYYYDNNEHYKLCECGEIKDKANHTYGEAVENGDTKLYTCTGCGHQKQEIIQKVEVPVEPATSNTIYIILIVIEAVSIIGLAALMVLKKKNNIE